MSKRGLNGRNTAPVTSGEPTGSVPFIFHKRTGAITHTTGSEQIVNALPFSVRVLDFWVIPRTTTGGATTLQLRTGTTAITEALAAQTADTLSRVEGAGAIDVTYDYVPKGQDLNVLCGTANSVLCDVYVLCVRADAP